MAPGIEKHIYNTKQGTNKCNNSSTSLQMSYIQSINQSGQVFGLGQLIYNPNTAHKVDWPKGLQGK